MTVTVFHSETGYAIKYVPTHPPALRQHRPKSEDPILRHHRKLIADFSYPTFGFRCRLPHMGILSSYST